MATRLAAIIRQQATRYGSREAYRFCWRKDGEWLSTSWEDFNLQVNIAAKAMVAMGLLEKDTVAICSPNTPQILITEFGAFRNRITVIPIYSSSSQEQFDYILSKGEARVVFVGDSHQYPLAISYWKRFPDRIKKIVLFKNDGVDISGDEVSILWDDFVRMGMEVGPEISEEVESRTSRGLPEDMATLIFTSGTTGEPKGVAITHSNYDAAIDSHLELLTSVSDNDLSMAFLPMSHILEKAWCFFCITKGIRIAVNYDPRLIQDTIHNVHPNIMCCVPRFWEKVYAGVKEKVAASPKLQRIAFSRAVRCGKKRNLNYVRLGKKAPYFLEKEYRFWDKRLFSKIKKVIGIPNPNLFPTAGAPLSDRITEFLRSIGIEVLIGYGLSETTATVSFYPAVDYEIGTVGVPLPGLDVRIDKNGEILVKGPTVTPGYYKNAKANEEAFTADGFFRTGDAGYFTRNGALVLTERVKDLFKTSNGKYIAPQQLESRLAENKYIDEVAVIGDQRKYVTALVVPNLSQLRRWAEEQHIDYSDTERFVTLERVNAFVMAQVNEMQKGVAEYEKIKKITLLPNHFSIMNGEVTNTMKVRRPIVAKRYSKEIEAMYS